ncbi:LON peptidase substrate-binding domain-containing protein [Qipengyuania aquimaris]|uniref:LON peptidase substrate-binding domain-containing protein n=1 Tax=Qipengyuania aquimaris TaxID=255984 RepID=UPI001FCF97E1|nr:LON peptidase substrate-binding domain-containing protein [Qipengyuania aquimaris]UOR15934.1 LON peptidase substrate-binding domain-containing protein [Qipengyuania aquimaris]
MTRRLSIFPLPGAILFPGLQLPLHIFEPRYRELVGSALAKDRLIGMIQPQRGGEGSPLYEIGCVGRIGDVEALEDGRYNIVLEGEARFRVLRELDVTTAFRQVEAELIEDPEDQILASVERAGFEFEAKRFAAMQGYSVDWDSVERLDDETLINGVAQIAPFDPAAKQALLQAGTLSERCELMIQLMQFFALRDDGDEIVTLQ